MTKRTLAGTLRGLGAVLVLAGVLATYASRILFNEEAFGRRVAASLEDDRVADLVADQLTTALVLERPDLTSVRPILLGAVRAVVGSGAFRSIAERGARRAHQSVLDGTAGRLVVSLPDFGVILRSALSTSPELADKLPSGVVSAVSRLNELPLSRQAALLLRFARISGPVALGTLALGIVLTILGIVLAPRRRRALMEVGETWLGLGVVLAGIGAAGGLLARAVIGSPALADPIMGIWAGFMGGLRPMGWIVGLVGLACAASVSSLEELPDFNEGLRRLRQWVQAPPGGTLGKVVRGTILLAIGVFAVVQPGFAARALAFLVGALVAFLGLRELFALALPTAIADERVTDFDGVARRAALRVAFTAAGVLAAIVGGFFLMQRGPAIVTALRGCNGAEALCTKPLDQVTFAGTHNSMAAADVPGWLMPNHERGIAAQLTDGVRALLIDVTWGIPVDDRVRTELDDESAARAKYEAALGAEGVDAALRIRDRLVPGEGAERELYLCHGFCELGAYPLAEALETLRGFLATHPNEVLLMVIQDEGVTSAEIAVAFEEAGLVPYVYDGPFTAPWPTLGQLIDAGTRLLVSVEHDHGTVPWIPNTYDVFQETPYAFPTPESMTCVANRGADGNPLFLVNHFIERVPPLPSAAAPANTREFLLQRARRCQRERGMQPTVLAVDFYRTGDLLGAVAELNGVESRESSVESP